MSTIKTGGAYPFKDKDPIIDEVRTTFKDHFGNYLDASQLRKVQRDGGPSASCMHGWFHGATRRPQNATVEAALRAMGYERVIRHVRKGKRNGRAT